MQNDFEHGMSLAPIQGSCDEVLPAGKEYLPKGVKLEEAGGYSYIPDETGSLDELNQQAQVGKKQRAWRLQRFSPAVWPLIVKAGDGALLFLSFALALLLAPALHPSLEVLHFAIRSWDSKLVWGSLALITWLMVAKIMRAQELITISSRLQSPFYALCTLVLMCIFWMILTYPFTTDEAVYIKITLFFLVLTSPVLIIWRVLLAGIICLPRFRRQAVIVGVNISGETLADQLRSAKSPNISVLGYISENAEQALQRDELPILGDRNTLRHLVQSGAIDMIIMAINYNVNPELFQEAIEAVQLGLSVVPMTMIYEWASGRIPVEHVGDHWYVALPSEMVVSPFYLCWRKVMDIAFSLFGLVALCLAWLVLAPLIILSSQGPVFYSQERVGYRGRKYRILKFRSMYVDAENTGLAVWASEHDTRVTQIGRFMRATHLDELPQVFNILRGEMSLVGPRPERPAFVAELQKTIPFYRCRLSVKPGLTGWAQVRYPYASTNNDALMKLQYDLYYIKHQSFALDILIILKTVVEVLSCHGR